MPRVRCLVPIDVLVMVSERTGRRYRFTQRQREVAVDEGDVQQFDAKTIRISACGCTGGKKGQDKRIKVFEIVSGG